jgi:metal-sulfur cluster biosynthetic enzyme
MTTATRETITGWVYRALATVVDPELHESITDLGFVTSADVVLNENGGLDVQVKLRLPTYFCAPNFAYLMVADARDAVLALPSVDHVLVVLEDHFAADAINAGVSAMAGFTGSFPEQAIPEGTPHTEAGSSAEELSELRTTFRRKAHLACLERACRTLIETGWQVDALADSKLGDLPETPERDSLLRRRTELGLPLEPDAPLFVEHTGERVSAVDLPAQLRFAKAVRVSIEGNAGLCRGLLRTRYDRIAEEEQE